MAERTKCEICNRDFPSQDALNMHNSAKHQEQKPEKNPKKIKLIVIIIILSILLIGGWFIFFNKSINGNSIVNPNNNEEIQKINLGFNGNYYPNTITVKEGIPVEITLDNSVKGCFRTLVIKDLGVMKTSSKPSEKITFTPSKKGSFIFACGMHMGTGTIIVE